MAQLHHPPQRSLKGLADRLTGLLLAGPIVGSLLLAVPVSKHLPLQLRQLRSESFANSVARAVSWLRSSSFSVLRA
jgi:hypothetical protein